MRRLHDAGLRRAEGRGHVGNMCLASRQPPGRAYLQLLQPVFTLGLLALLRRMSPPLELELEVDIGPERHRAEERWRAVS